MGAGVFEVEELSDKELSDGESKLVLRACWGDGETAGESDLPLPNILPPPRVLPEVMVAIMGG